MGCDAGGDRVAVSKVQVGLLGSARQLQRDLERMTRKANTNTPEGLHYLLQGEPFRCLAELLGHMHTANMDRHVNHGRQMYLPSC